MRIIRSINKIKKEIVEIKKDRKTIGFVPTMGALHNGHISLIRKARKENDVVIISIFVNPTQFGPNEDYKRYPRPFKKDIKISNRENVDIIFYPSPNEMYPEGYLTYVNVEKLSKLLCGVTRPTHFRGVTTVVLKLFNIVKPDVAYFGQKDFQQFKIIEKMTKDLNLDIRLKMCPIVREKSGLALSSRNRYLSLKQRKQALSLFRALKEAKQLILQGERSSKRITSYMKRVILSEPETRIDYIKIVKPTTLEEVRQIENKVAILLAVYIGKTRLIDNIIV